MALVAAQNVAASLAAAGDAVFGAALGGGDLRRVCSSRVVPDLRRGRGREVRMVAAA